MAITDAETQDLLGRARVALQQGDKATARDLLIRLLERDDRNARAWLLLSGAVDDVEEQRICLENVLTLEPGNNPARQGLEYLNRMYPPQASPAAPPSAPAQPQPSGSAPRNATAPLPGTAPAPPPAPPAPGHTTQLPDAAAPRGPVRPPGAPIPAGTAQLSDASEAGTGPAHQGAAPASPPGRTAQLPGASPASNAATPPAAAPVAPGRTANLPDASTLPARAGGEPLAPANPPPAVPRPAADEGLPSWASMLPTESAPDAGQLAGAPGSPAAYSDRVSPAVSQPSIPEGALHPPEPGRGAVPGADPFPLRDWPSISATSAPNGLTIGPPLASSVPAEPDWGGPESLVHGPAEHPAPPAAEPDDPWAELRANLQAQADSPAPAWTPPQTPAAPIPPPLPEAQPALPSWAGDPSPAPGPPADLRFGLPPLGGAPAGVPDVSTAAGGGPPAVSNLPDWAMSISPTGSAGTGTSPEAGPAGLPSWTRAPGNAGPPFPDQARDDAGFGASPSFNAAGLEAAGPEMAHGLGGSSLPPDSPWAGAFGGGLGLGAMPASGAEAVPGQSFGEIGSPGFDFGGSGLGDLGSSPSLISRPPLAGRTAPATPSFPCPNCGELVSGNALSCTRCHFRFYAACPSCGEYMDTSDPDPTGGDTCPRCGKAVDKLALGRSETTASPAQSARDVIIAQIPQTRPASERAAVVAVKQAREQSAARALIGILVVLALVIFLLYVLPALMENAGISLDSSGLIGLPTRSP